MQKCTTQCYAGGWKGVCGGVHSPGISNMGNNHCQKSKPRAKVLVRILGVPWGGDGIFTPQAYMCQPTSIQIFTP